MSLVDQIGLKGPSYDVYIERGKVREFARAMQAPLPEFLDGEKQIIPATFLVSAPYTWGYTLERPRGTAFADIDHDLTVSLHAEESFSFYGPLPFVGEKLIATPSLEKTWEKHGRNGGKLTFLTLLNEYRDQAGALRAEQRSTSVTTENAPGEGKWSPRIPAYDPYYKVLESESIFRVIERTSFSALKTGASANAITSPPLSKQEIVRFQGVVGEDDPLHHDPEWAAKQDYPSVFALGTHLASQLAAYASYWLDPTRIRNFKTRFREVGWPGDIYTYSGTVDQLNSEKQTATIHLTCTRHDGTLINEAWAAYDFS